MKAILRSTELNMINIPSKLWKKLGWKLNDQIELIVSEEYNNSGHYSHNTITIERIEDQTIKEEE